MSQEIRFFIHFLHEYEFDIIVPNRSFLSYVNLGVDKWAFNSMLWASNFAKCVTTIFWSTWARCWSMTIDSSTIKTLDWWSWRWDSARASISNSSKMCSTNRMQISISMQTICLGEFESMRLSSTQNSGSSQHDTSFFFDEIYCFWRILRGTQFNICYLFMLKMKKSHTTTGPRIGHSNFTMQSNFSNLPMFGPLFAELSALVCSSNISIFRRTISKWIHFFLI